MHRVLAAALAALLTVVGSARVMDCAGWKPSAAERMACCQRAHDGSADQAIADACCARSEQGQAQNPETTTVAVRPAVAAAFAIPDSCWLPRAAAAASFEKALLQRPSIPPFLLTHTLLI